MPEKFILIQKQLQAARVPHAFGGDLALAYYVEPSVTMRIELHVFVPNENWHKVIEALTTLSVETEDLDWTTLEQKGECQLRWGECPVDLFFAYNEIHEEMREEVRRVPFASTMLPILAPEHLAICKAMFDRPKDWLDIEQMLVATDDLDIAAIEERLERMVGEDDPRLQRLYELKVKLAISS